MLSKKLSDHARFRSVFFMKTSGAAISGSGRCHFPNGDTQKKPTYSGLLLWSLATLLSATSVEKFLPLPRSQF